MTARPAEADETVPVFRGVGVALATIFDGSGALDATTTAELAVRLVDEGVTAVVVAGSTGEAGALEREERRALVEAVRAAVPADVPVVAGTGAASSRQAAVLTRDAVDAGADAVLVLSPLRIADPRPYYEAVRGAAGDVAVLAYHFPAVSPPGIDLDVLADLPVAGVKDSSADPARLLATLDRFTGSVYVGSSALLVQAGAVGCAGAILAAANLDPATCVAAFGGDGDAQRRLLVAHETAAARFPRGLKEALADRYGTSPAVRIG